MGRVSRRGGSGLHLRPCFYPGRAALGIIKLGLLVSLAHGLDGLVYMLEMYAQDDAVAAIPVMSGLRSVCQRQPGGFHRRSQSELLQAGRRVRHVGQEFGRQLQASLFAGMQSFGIGLLLLRHGAHSFSIVRRCQQRGFFIQQAAERLEVLGFLGQCQAEVGTGLGREGAGMADMV